MTDKNLCLLKDLIPHVDTHVISQGAEGIVLLTSTHPYISDPFLRNPQRYIIKFRPPKPYRHSIIDASITKSRTVGEVKFMAKLQKLKIPSPALIFADIPNGIIWMEYRGDQLSDGSSSSLKNWLWQLEKGESKNQCLSELVKSLCVNVGEIIGRLHINDMIHGDLTSSNIMIEDSLPVLIDFGLSSYSNLAEDKAVDIYVLERAILSTHSMFAAEYTQWILDGYELVHHSSSQKSDKKKLQETMKKLEDVRLRGRKRSMLG